MIVVSRTFAKAVRVWGSFVTFGISARNAGYAAYPQGNSVAAVGLLIGPSPRLGWVDMSNPPPPPPPP